VRLTELPPGARHCLAMPDFSRLSLPLDTPPMEAKLTDAIPEGEGWQFEPKWDGFRCLAFRDGNYVELMSKSGKPLARYFPEVAEALFALAETRFILDGELILPVGDVLSFAALHLRPHPAAARIEKLARDAPAQLLLFDCLQAGSNDLTGAPLSKRRTSPEGFMKKAAGPRLLLSPVTTDPQNAEQWLASSGGALDGI